MGHLSKQRARQVVRRQPFKSFGCGWGGGGGHNHSSLLDAGGGGRGGRDVSQHILLY